jgi:hypothetical protein
MTLSTSMVWSSAQRLSGLPVHGGQHSNHMLQRPQSPSALSHVCGPHCTDLGIIYPCRHRCMDLCYRYPCQLAAQCCWMCSLHASPAPLSAHLLVLPLLLDGSSSLIDGCCMCRASLTGPPAVLVPIARSGGACACDVALPAFSQICVPCLRIFSCLFSAACLY